MQECASTYLVLRFKSVGNVAMMLPVLASVAAANPDKEFVVVAKKRLGDMFCGMSNVHFLSADNADGKSKSVPALLRDIRRNYKITHVVDLQRSWQSTIISLLLFLAGSQMSRVSNERMAQRRLIRHGFWRSKPLPTEFLRYKAAFEHAGLQSGNTFKQLPLNMSAQHKVEQKFGSKQGIWLGIAPFAKSKTNMLPYRISKEVIMHFAGKKNVRLFLFGAGRVECEMLGQWADLSQNIESVAGRLPLSEELELMRHLDLMLCMDSANQHLASLVGLRCLSVWMGTHTYSGFYGWQQNEEDKLEQRLSCRPCTVHGKNSCSYRNFLCRNFSAEEIIDRVEAIIGKQKDC